jgi:hypothetical protein
MHFLLSQVILCVWKGVQNTAGRNFEWEEKMVKYHHIAVGNGTVIMCSELSICGESALWQHLVNVSVMNCAWWCDSPVRSTQLVDWVVREMSVNCSLSAFLLQRANCVRSETLATVCLLSKDVMADFYAKLCTEQLTAVVDIYHSICQSCTVVSWAHALGCVYVHHSIFQCSHTTIRWTCRLFCSRALKWIEYCVRVRVVRCEGTCSLMWGYV